MALIPDETELRVFKLYLPYILIIAQSWIIFQLATMIYNTTQQQLKDERQNTKEQREEKVFWRNSLLDLKEAYETLPDHANDKDTTGNDGADFPASRGR